MFCSGEFVVVEYTEGLAEKQVVWVEKDNLIFSDGTSCPIDQATKTDYCIVLRFPVNKALIAILRSQMPVETTMVTPGMILVNLIEDEEKDHAIVHVATVAMVAGNKTVFNDEGDILSLENCYYFGERMPKTFNRDGYFTQEGISKYREWLFQKDSPR